METTVENRKYPSKGIGKNRQSNGHAREASGFIAEGQAQYSFLTETFSDLCIVDLPGCEKPFGQIRKGGNLFWEYEPTGICIDAKQNIKYLEDSVRAYCNAHSKEFIFKKTKNPFKDLNTLYNIANDVKPSENHLVLDYDEQNNLIVIKEYQMCPFDDNTLFFLPIKFVEKIPEGLKGLVMDALAHIVKKFQLPEPEDQMDFQYALGIWEEDADYWREMYGDEYEDFVALCDSYKTGRIKSLIMRCMNVEKYSLDETIKKLEVLIPERNHSPLSKLLSSILDGLKMDWFMWEWYKFTPDSCTIEDYDEHDEGSFMDMERLFAVTYDIEDDITQRVEDCLNNEASALEITGFYDWRTLTPEIDEPFVADIRLLEWCKWFNKLVMNIEEYGKQ